MHKNQKDGIEKLVKGYITDISTGEGKTFIILISAIVKALQGSEIVVITPNEYLNKRDFELCKSVVSSLNITCSENHVDTDKDLETKKAIYSSNIVYTTSSEFVFDYLRGKSDVEFTNSLLSKSIIIDEIDQILVDNSNTNYSISTDSKYLELDEVGMYSLIYNLCKFLKGGEVSGNLGKLDINDSLHHDFIYNKSEGYVFLTIKGENKIKNLIYNDINSTLSLHLMSAVYNTLKAVHMLEKNVEYILIDSQINIIDKNNGRYKKNNKYSSGLNLALEIKEGCSISSISDTDESINSLFFFSKFDSLVGCSGTAYECKDLFKDILKNNTIKIKRNKKLQLTYSNSMYFENKDLKYNYIKSLLKNLQNKNLPVLVVGENDIDCVDFFSYIKNDFNNLKMLTNAELDNEIDIINSSGKENSILVSTLICGRGTDIKISESISEKGGLQVIFLSKFANVRAEKQIIGRTGRQGSKGCIYFNTSLDDEIFKLTPIEERRKLAVIIKNLKFKKLDKIVNKQQEVWKGLATTNIKRLYYVNSVLNTFENYLGANYELDNFTLKDFLYEIENFIYNYPMTNSTELSTCVIECKKFVDDILLRKGSKYIEYNVESSM